MAKRFVDVQDMVEEYLKKHGYDGLYSEDECACRISDLAPCCEMQFSCYAGYLGPCDCGDHDWHIGPKKVETPL